MILVNGERSTVLSVADRGLQYGDGLFETLALNSQGVEFWLAHMARLRQSCQRLSLPCPDEVLLWAEVCQVARSHGERAVIKITLTRGEGGRGYLPPTEIDTGRIVASYPWPSYSSAHIDSGVDVCLSSVPLGLNPYLAGIKHLSRLEQVLASAELRDTSCAEALMLDINNNVIEGTKSNLFLVKNNQLISADLSSCGVAGIIRDTVFLLAEQAKLEVSIDPISTKMLAEADEVFLTNSIMGIWPVKCIESQGYPVGPITRQLMAALDKLKLSESTPCL